MPVLLNVEEGLEMVCAGGKVHEYGVLSESSSDELIVSKELKNPGKGIVLFYLGKEYAEAMDRPKIIIPSSAVSKYGIHVHFVE